MDVDALCNSSKPASPSEVVEALLIVDEMDDGPREPVYSPAKQQQVWFFNHEDTLIFANSVLWLFWVPVRLSLKLENIIQHGEI